MQRMVWKAKLCVQSCQQTLVRGGVGLVLEPCMELHVLDDSLESGHSLLVCLQSNGCWHCTREGNQGKRPYP
jgi:hypothetical protein